MKTRMSHTPTPWRYSRSNPSPTTGEHMISGATPGYLAEIRDCGSGNVQMNAKHIVKCVNAHDELVAACMAALRTPNIYDTDQQSGETPESLIRAALAKVAHE